MYRTLAILVMSASWVGCAAKSPPSAAAPQPSLAERLFGSRRPPAADDSYRATSDFAERRKDDDY